MRLAANIRIFGGMDEFRFSKTRIAPTPSGFLHKGNGFSFVLTALIAKKTGARILLRIDDLDRERFRPEYLNDIFVQLEWLGIEPNEGPSSPDDFTRNHSQHTRIPEYLATIDRLLGKGALYACECSRKAFSMRSGPHCACHEIDLSPSDNRVLRLKELPEHHLLNDLGGSNFHFNLADTPGAIPILQKNRLPSYQIASIVDDAAMGIDLVVRGADLLPSSAFQQHLADELGMHGYREMAHFHHRLIFDQGEKMSKSAGAVSLRHFANGGGRVSDFYAWVASMLHIEPYELRRLENPAQCLEAIAETISLQGLVAATGETPV